MEENLHNIFSHFKKVIRQIRNNSPGSEGLYRLEDFDKLCESTLTRSLSYDPSEVIKIAESLLTEVLTLEQDLDSLDFRNPDLDMFDPEFGKGGYSKEEAKNLMQNLKESLIDITDTNSQSASQEFTPIPIGTNIKTFSNLMGVMVRAGIIQPETQEEMYRLIQRSFAKKDGTKSTIGVIRNNFKKLDTSGAYSPEKTLDIINKIKSQAEKES